MHDASRFLTADKAPELCLVTGNSLHAVQVDDERVSEELVLEDYVEPWNWVRVGADLAGEAGKRASCGTIWKVAWAGIRVSAREDAEQGKVRVVSAGRNVSAWEWLSSSGGWKWGSICGRWRQRRWRWRISTLFLLEHDRAAV